METHSHPTLRLVQPTQVDLHQRLAANDQVPPRIGDVLLGLFDVAVEFVSGPQFFVGFWAGTIFAATAALIWGLVL